MACPCHALARVHNLLQRIAAVLREMEADAAFAPLAERVAGNATGGIPGLCAQIERCLASATWGGEEGGRKVDVES